MVGALLGFFTGADSIVFFRTVARHRGPSETRIPTAREQGRSEGLRTCRALFGHSDVDV